MKNYQKFFMLSLIMNIVMGGGVEAQAQTIVENPGCDKHDILKGRDLKFEDWWNAFSPTYIINNGETLTFTFNHKYKNEGKEGTIGNPWTLYASTLPNHNQDAGNPGSSAEMSAMGPTGRDGWGIVSWNERNYTGTFTGGNEEEFNAAMSSDYGVDVTIKVSFINHKYNMRAESVDKDGKKYVATLNEIEVNNVDQLYLFFCGNNSTLSNFGVATYGKWAIFEETAMSPSTWNGLRVHNDLETPTPLNNGGWVKRSINYKRLKALNEEQIVVNGKTLFPGVYFTASENDDNEGNTGSLEIAPKTYRVFLNNNGTRPTTENDGENAPKNHVAYFTLKDVPAGHYIWIEAMTNEDQNKGSDNITGVYFNVEGKNGGTVTRYDDKTNDTEEETAKHIFSYRVNTTDDYKIVPTRACYIYYIAIKPNPLPVLSFENPKYPDDDQHKVNVGENHTYELVCNINNKPAAKDVPVTYFSDDETVATVDKNGTVKFVGKGRVAITATLPAGSTYIVNSDAEADKGNVFTLDYDVIVSDTITVEDSRVISYNKLDGKTTTQLWESWDCKKGDETLIKMYMGGWKYQKQSDATSIETSALADLYLATSDTYTGSGRENDGSPSKSTDKWKASTTWSLGKESVKEYQTMPMDGFGPYTSGSSNGKSEFLFTDLLWESDYVGRFSTRPYNDENSNGNPFTVPCIGDFVKFEPEVNGTVTLYVLQNGCIDSNDNYQLVGKIAWRPVYIVDESGTCLSDDEVKAVTKQRTMYSRTDQTTDVYDRDATDAEYRDMPFADAIKEYSDIDKTTGVNIYETHKHVFDDDKYWSRRGTYEKVLGPKITSSTPKPEDKEGTWEVQTGGWVVITKSYVKYQFPVKAGKSYYVFSNKAKLGICGYTFLPDENEEGVIAEYTLSENKTDNTDAYEELNDLLNKKGKDGKLTVKEMTVKHTFHQGWNSICLPFSITESKMRELFGSKTVTEGANKGKKMEDYELVLFNGSEDLSDTSNKAYFFHHVYQDIIAGYPYMIYLNKDAYVLSEDYKEKGSFTVKNVTLENVKTSVNDISITTSEDYMPAGSRFEGNATSKDFTFKGVYAPEYVPEGSYLVVNTGFKIYKPTTLPGYRSYLHPSYSNPARPDETEAKRITANNLSELGFFWDEANPIKDIMADAYGDDTNGRMQPTNVYHASGMLVRKGTTSLDGLPKGVYIVNGKKILK